MMAAITAAREGASVTIYERNDRLGKKILATGNGKCNLSNIQLSKGEYHSSDMALLEKCLEQFGTAETIAFFEGIGLMVKEKNGGLYPVSEQAASVLDVLRMTVESCGVKVRYETKINRIQRQGNGFVLGWEGCLNGNSQSGNGQKDNGEVVYDSVIIACGSKASPKTGSDGSGYKLAKQLGIAVTPVVPALVQLQCREEYCKAIAGVRSDAVVHIYDGKKLIARERGELQLTEYGISGIPVFQLSALVNRLQWESKGQKELLAEIDFLPDISTKEWEGYARRRLAGSREQNVTVEAFFTGMLNKKLMTLFIKLAGLKTNALLQEVPEERLLAVFDLCKKFRLHVTGSNSYDSAQICAGGVDMREVTGQLEAKSAKGIYFAGEVLDVDGRCGGYNLQWAWTSGYLAGKAAAGS